MVSSILRSTTMQQFQILVALSASFCGVLVRGAGISVEDYRAAMFAMNQQQGDKAVPPVGDGSSPIRVGLGLDLISIRDVDKSRNEVEVVAWLLHEWTDDRLAWLDTNYAEFRTNYGSGGNPVNVSHFPVDAESLWRPDITLFNGVLAPEILTPNLALVIKDGSILYIPGFRYRFTCDLKNVSSSSGAECSMKFGSWVHHDQIIDLQTRNNGAGTGIGMSDYAVNPNYHVMNTRAERSAQRYACCPELYTDIKFFMTIREKNGPGSFIS